jgi:transcriptional regulator NrdR family protein
MRQKLIKALIWLYEVHRDAHRESRQVVSVEVSRELAEQLQGWSELVQVRFASVDGKWAMFVRSARAAQQEHQQNVAQRAARQ